MRSLFTYISTIAILAVLTYVSVYWQNEKNKKLLSNKPYQNFKNQTDVSAENVQESTSPKRKKRLPDFICIGVEKCGSSALIRFSEWHPLLRVQEPSMEPHYFDIHFRKGLDFYLSRLPAAAEGEFVMEKTPGYFNSGRDVANAMKKLLPDVKVVVVLCDPVNRAYSDFVHEKVTGLINQTEEYGSFVKSTLNVITKSIPYFQNKSDKDILEKIHRLRATNHATHVITTGMYYYHMQHWLEVFGADKIHVMDGELLINDPGKAFIKMQKFLEIPVALTEDSFEKNTTSGFYCFKNSTDESLKCMSNTKGRTRLKENNIQPEVVDKLKQFFRPYSEKLFKLIGQRFDWQ